MSLATRFGCLACALLLLTLPATAEELAIPGSGNPEVVLRKIAEVFNASQKEHRVTIPTSTGTAGAIRDVSEGNAVLGRVGRRLKESERATGLDYVALGRDAVVFVAGAGVSVRAVTSAQMYDVFSGKVTDWRQLGGNGGPIRVVGREVTDASRAVIDASIKPFATLQYPETVKIVHLDPQLIELLDRFPTSIGYLNASGLRAASTRVVPLALDGVEPTLDNLSAGRYPMSIELGLIHRSGKLTPAARAFLVFLETPTVDRILREHGVLPLGSAQAKAH